LEVNHESLRQYQMRNIWPHRLLGGDSLSNLQMGFEADSSCQRGCTFAETGSAGAGKPLIATNTKHSLGMPGSSNVPLIIFLYLRSTSLREFR
jgi:hypothetical protein